MPPETDERTQRLNDTMSLIRTALNRPRRLPVNLVVKDYGCIADVAHKVDENQYLPWNRQVNGIAKNDYAHRVVFRAHHGADSLNDGLEVDHICGNTYCLNIDHLHPVEKSFNVSQARIYAENRKVIQAEFYWHERSRCDAAELAEVMKISKSRATSLIKEWRSKEISTKNSG